MTPDQLTRHPPDTGHVPFPGASEAGDLVRRFLAQAATHERREAVVTPATRWTYGKTAELSGRIASALAGAGPRPGERVGLLFAHGAEMIAALLGTLRAGLSYVPLDAAYPESRLRFMAADAGVTALVTDAGNAPLAARMAVRCPVLAYESLASGAVATSAAAIAPSTEAYVLYTSGSTGRPKPVTQTHRNVLHHTRAWTDGLGIGPLDRVTLQSAYSWDSAVQDTFSALLNGAALYPVNLKELGISGLLDWMAREQLTVYHSTVPVFRSLVRAMDARGTRLPALRMLALGGDALHRADLDDYRRAFGEHCRLAGAYGSTECSCALLRIADRDYRPPTGTFPLGTPVAGTQVWLEGQDGRVVTGPGEGEVVVASSYLAPASAANGGVLRTGDLARRLDDGTLVLIGRRDFQVKISGIRVEPGEVEAALKDLPEVREAIVMPFTDRQGERQLAANVVTEGASRPAPSTLRSALRLVLPAHAVPTAFVFLDALPLTANHKIDRAALPNPLTTAAAASPAAAAGSPGAAAGSPGAAAASPGAAGGLPEQAIAAVWCEVLGRSAVGLDENFYDLGGTSLRMAAVHERLTRRLAPGLSMVDLYRAPTVRALARLIAPAATPGADRGSAAERGARRRAARVTHRVTPIPGGRSD